VEFGDGRNERSNVLLKVFSVVGVAAVSMLLIPLCRLVLAYIVGARSEVLSDSFGLFPGDGDDAGFIMAVAAESGEIMDSGVVSRRDNRCGGVGVAIVLVEDISQMTTTIK
jgi:hypothetical protein